MTHPSAAAGAQDPAALITALRQTAASFRAEAARIGGALATSATASDRLCTLTVTGRGEITDVAFTPDITVAGPAALERSVQTVYADASRAVAAAPSGTAPTSEAGPDGIDVTEAAQRLAAIDQWGKAGVTSAAPTPDPEVLADPARFGDVLAERIDRIFAAFDRAGPQLQHIVGRAASELCIVEAGPDGLAVSVRFTPRAPAAGPEVLAQDLLATLRAAAADSARQRDTLLDDPSTAPGGRP